MKEREATVSVGRVEEGELRGREEGKVEVGRKGRYTNPDGLTESFVSS